jgi:hypothetical protein
MPVWGWVLTGAGAWMAIGLGAALALGRMIRAADIEDEEDHLAPVIYLEAHRAG